MGRSGAKEGWDPINPNRAWILTPGLWLWYLLIVVLWHIALLSVPVFSTMLAWTLTNITHSLVRARFRMLPPPGILPLRGRFMTGGGRGNHPAGAVRASRWPTGS